MKVAIFGGAAIEDYAFCHAYLQEVSLVICCDGGMEHARALGLSVDYIVGDFDSVSKETLAYYEGQKIPIFSFPTKKDETDMQLGIRLALEKGGTDLVLFGGIGNRLDHTLGNAQLLLGLVQAGVRARLVDANNCVELIDGPMQIEGAVGELVSLLPLSMMVRGITLTGFEYPLTEYDLKINDAILAVSNTLAAPKAEISLKEGYLFVIRARD